MGIKPNLSAVIITLCISLYIIQKNLSNCNKINVKSLQKSEYKEPTEDQLLRTWFCGINYKETRVSSLNGCINDAQFLSEMISEKNINSDFSYFLCDRNKKQDIYPTTQNMVESLSTLVKNINPDKKYFIFISFAGHGIRVFDNDGEEKDNFDECLVPWDYDNTDNTIIIDDQLNEILVSPIISKPNVWMIVLLDCCYSGTGIDLPYQYNTTEQSWYQSRSTNQVPAIQANIIMISGCRDDQLSADAYINFKFRGAMTTSFIESIKTNDSIIDILNGMRSYLENNGFDQIPQLTCSKELDVNTTLFNPDFIVTDDD